MVPIALFVCVAVTSVGVPIAKAAARRIERGDSGDLRPTPLPNELTMRLERMEQAIDSIAIEVERIAEGQRFTTKLLAERNNSGASGVPEAQS